MRITSDPAGPNFQQATADIDLKDGPFASVRLVIDLASTCYPFSNWHNDPPPAGQNWPADCDAFDRNFEFSIDDPVTPTDPPGIEVERAITPFGGPLHLEVDLTDLANGLPGRHRLKTTIPTWSDAAGQVSGSHGGWNVSARIEATPGTPPRRVLAVLPLFYGNQDPGLAQTPIAFQVPVGTTHSRLEYRVTGHGGGASDSDCIGPAEEFCKRTHTLYVDGQQLDQLQPWRNDCASNCTLTHQGPLDGGFDYCLQNPCGDIRSVCASRANWCPGTETPPFTWDAAALESPGSHSLRWDISRIATGGSWRISAVYYAFGD